MASQGDPEYAGLDLLVRVCTGGFSAPQIEPFIAANKSFGKISHYCYKCVDPTSKLNKHLKVSLVEISAVRVYWTTVSQSV